MTEECRLVMQPGLWWAHHKKRNEWEIIEVLPDSEYYPQKVLVIGCEMAYPIADYDKFIGIRIPRKKFKEMEE